MKNSASTELRPTADVKQVLPKVIWEELVATHVGECTLPPRVLAAQCAMLRNCYETLLNVTEALRIVTERYGSITGP